MDNAEIKKIAFSALCEDVCKNIEINECANMQVMPYGFNRTEEVLFSYCCKNEQIIGRDKYLSVSKKTGEVRFYGRYGD